MRNLKNSMKEMKFVEDFENDGKKLYDQLTELSNNSKYMYFDVIQNVVFSGGKLIHNWLSQLQLNKLMKIDYIEYELIIMLYDENKNLIKKINVLY